MAVTLKHMWSLVRVMWRTSMKGLPCMQGWHMLTTLKDGFGF